MPRIELPRPAESVVSVVIPTVSELRVEQALTALVPHADGDIPFEVIVVANGLPGLAAALRANTSGVTVVESAVNRGLAAALNLGRSVATGEFLLCLHDDSQLRAGWMATMVATAAEHPEAGVFGGAVYEPDGGLQGMGMVLYTDGTTGVPWKAAGPSAAVLGEVRAVDYCGSSALLVRTSLLDAIGGLDERFHPAYCVDVDLGLAARRAGSRVMVQPRAGSVHVRGASSSPHWRHFLNRTNRERLRTKWAAELATMSPPPPLGDAERAALLAAERPLLPVMPAHDHGAPLPDEWFTETERRLLQAHVAELEQQLDDATERLGRLRRRARKQGSPEE